MANPATWIATASDALTLSKAPNLLLAMTPKVPTFDSVLLDMATPEIESV